VLLLTVQSWLQALSSPHAPSVCRSECLHGAATDDDAGATIFPQSIGLAATFDRDLLGRVASAIGDELRAKSNEAEQRGLPPRRGRARAGSWVHLHATCHSLYCARMLSLPWLYYQSLPQHPTCSASG